MQSKLWNCLRQVGESQPHLKSEINSCFLAETVLKAGEEVADAPAASRSTLDAGEEVPEGKEKPETPEDELISMETLRASPVQWPERCECKKRVHLVSWRHF